MWNRGTPKKSEWRLLREIDDNMIKDREERGRKIRINDPYLYGIKIKIKKKSTNIYR